MRVAEALAVAWARQRRAHAPSGRTLKRDPFCDSATGRVRVRKSISFARKDDEQRIAYAEVYVPGDLDVHGELMLPGDIALMGRDFMRRGLTGAVDFNHDNRIGRAAVVESFINDETVASPNFTPDAWVAGTWFAHKGDWESVKRGDLGGYSFECDVIKVPVRVRVQRANEDVDGVTTKSWGGGLEPHQHRYVVHLDGAGNVVKGETDTVLGHRHVIVGNMRSEVALGHRHFFTVENPVEIIGRAA